MQFVKKNVAELPLNVFDAIGKQWYLLTAGSSPAAYNTMTASWGFMGVMWGTPSMICAVRTNRHTFSFLEQEELFSVSFFGEEQRAALQFCGTKSGREYDKAKETGLTPVELDGVMTFAEAKTVLICKKRYAGMFAEENFITPETLEKWYEKDPMHKQFVGEIIAAYVNE